MEREKHISFALWKIFLFPSKGPLFDRTSSLPAGGSLRRANNGKLFFLKKTIELIYQNKKKRMFPTVSNKKTLYIFAFHRFTAYEKKKKTVIFLKLPRPLHRAPPPLWVSPTPRSWSPPSPGQTQQPWGGDSGTTSRLIYWFQVQHRSVSQKKDFFKKIFSFLKACGRHPSTLATSWGRRRRGFW